MLKNQIHISTAPIIACASFWTTLNWIEPILVVNMCFYACKHISQIFRWIITMFSIKYTLLPKFVPQHRKSLWFQYFSCIEMSKVSYSILEMNILIFIWEPFQIWLNIRGNLIDVKTNNQKVLQFQCFLQTPITLGFS